MTIELPVDEHGFTGRQCPSPGCRGQFNIEPGTGLKGEDLLMHCPYCGHTGSPSEFPTEDQVEYAVSLAKREISDAVFRSFKSREFSHTAAGGFGISMKVIPGKPLAIHQYREKQLETELVCNKCGLHYSVYGVFAFCPDCGQHNSLQILDKNLEVVRKVLGMAASSEPELCDRLVKGALGDCVAIFDGFGRELCRIHRTKATDPVRAESISFQNLEGARATLTKVFAVDLSAHITAEQWRTAMQGFQKRHLIAHKMGIVDPHYIKKTGDIQAVVGRKVNLAADDVRDLAGIIRKLAEGLSSDMK